MKEEACKLCGNLGLRTLDHVAQCYGCGALLFYPYPEPRELEPADGEDEAVAETWASWYARAAVRNHRNFTHMVEYALADVPTPAHLDILDYGGGGGQFAAVVRSLYPNARVWITDIADAALQPQWAGLNTQIPFADFETDEQAFDAIFLNDVFEHVSDPRAVLSLLAAKLKPGGRLFIDTPRTFWLYPTLRLVFPSLYRRLLRGTVSTAHLQLWTRRAFDSVIRGAGLKIIKYSEISEFTQPPAHYLRNMGITSVALRAFGTLFYRSAPLLAKNKITAVLARTGGA